MMKKGRFYLQFKNYVSIFIVLILCTNVSFAYDVNILDFGANPDGVSLNTKEIQNAIDECSRQGGGKIIIPAGIYLTGTIRLKSNIEYHLMKNAVLLGSTNHPDDYPSSALIQGEGVENVVITGFGSINGQGNNERFQYGDNAGNRPYGLIFSHSNNIKVFNISIINAAFWAFRLFRCENVTIDNITIYSHGNFNNDGIDIDAKRVTVSNCNIDCDDDAICLKSDFDDFLVEDVVVTNCNISTNCNAIKFGTAGRGGFRNVVISNCTVSRASEDEVRKFYTYTECLTHQPTIVAGIALEIVDGGAMDQVIVTNITMRDVQTPIFLRLGSRNGIGSLKNVLISNIFATTESLIPSSITGIPGAYIENVQIKDVVINCKGMGKEIHNLIEVPEVEKNYPCSRMFGFTLPAYGFYVRHVDGIQFENVTIHLRNTDKRPAFMFDDVYTSSIRNLFVDSLNKDQPLIRINQSKDILVTGLNINKEVNSLIRVEGENTKSIKLVNSDLRLVKKPFSVSKGVVSKELILHGNME